MPLNEDYWALTVALAAEAHEATEAVANFLWEVGATGVIEEEDRAFRGLRAFFPPPSDPAALRDRLTGYLDELRALDIPLGSGEVEVRLLPGEAWADLWRSHFRPLPIGRRLLVCPPWEAPAGPPPVGPAGPRTVVLIEPGRAFGNGSHATTRGCLELLERALDAVPVARLLDVGTGSGVLAIAAARLGVHDVRAIDSDPDAVAAATANAARNDVAGRVSVELGSLETWVGPPADLVLANLLGSAHVALAPALARRSAAAGCLIAGGLLVHEVPAVVGAFVPEGFHLVELVEHEGWATLFLARGARGV